MEHFSALFSNLFAQKHKRISANKFNLPHIESEFCLCHGRFCSMSLAGTCTRPCQGLKRVRIGDILAHWARTWACHSCGHGKIYARPQKMSQSCRAFYFFSPFFILTASRIATNSTTRTAPPTTISTMGRKKNSFAVDDSPFALSLSAASSVSER